MASRLVRALFVGGGAAAAALIIGIGSASADDPTWSVSAGAASGGSTVAFTGTTSGASPQISFSDVTSGLDLNCDSGTAGGSATVGTGLSGAGIATISGPSTTWTNCVGPLGIELDPTGVGNWSLNAASYAGGVTSGTISNITATVHNPDGNCDFTVTGTVNGTYDNASQALTVTPDPTLSISGVTGCFGLINEGDQASFSASYHVVANDAANNPVQITSP
ncbi:MAG TPA: hypothetical protein VH333_14900 [Pseudonocardiaceae bacterium]|jgi:hypothetical protein|nr:hypothetical protein [Pseudonocardiaceae bacterium]